jgi:hypothetical protein
MRELPASTAATVWNLTVGPEVGCLILGPDYTLAQCQKCHREWPLGGLWDSCTYAVQPGWWACPGGCNKDFWWGDDGTLDSCLPSRLVMPSIPPRGPEAAPWWNARLGRSLHVAVRDYEARRLQCTRPGCGAWWEAAWQLDGVRVLMIGWWRCPMGCTDWLAEQLPELAKKLDAFPLWEPPAELVLAASQSGAARVAPLAAQPSVSGDLPNDISETRRRVRRAEYTAQDVLDALVALMREGEHHDQAAVDYYLRRSSPPNRKNVSRALGRESMTWPQALARSRQLLTLQPTAPPE